MTPRRIRLESGFGFGLRLANSHLVGGVEHLVLGVGVLGRGLAQVRAHVVHEQPEPARAEAPLRLARVRVRVKGYG